MNVWDTTKLLSFFSTGKLNFQLKVLDVLLKVLLPVETCLHFYRPLSLEGKRGQKSFKWIVLCLSMITIRTAASEIASFETIFAYFMWWYVGIYVYIHQT